MASNSGGAKVKRKKLIILGTATNYGNAPYDDPDYEIWAVSSLLTLPKAKRVDVVFELHPERYWKKPEVLEVLNKFSGPVVMQDHYDEVPNSVKYPLDEVHKVFYMETMGEHLCVTNTISFMMALAYIQGYRHIETFGMYMEHKTEYGYQRPNCEFFVGFLHAKGVDVFIHGGEVLKAKFTYAFDEPFMLPQLLEDRRQIKGGMEQLRKELDAKQREVWQQEGGLMYNERLLKGLGGY